MIFCSFVIPTIGRPTLDRALQSLVNQTDPDWNAIVVADSVYGFCLPRIDNRILFVNLSDKSGQSNHGGYVRNHGISHTSGEWIGFLDDDDRLDHDYVMWLKQEQEGADIVVFRMRYSDGTTLPPGTDIIMGQVGISFAVRNSIVRAKTFGFGNSDIEDWAFLDVARNQGARIKVSSRTAYYVRH